MHQNPFRYWTPEKYKENERAYLWTIIVTGNDTYPHPLSIHQSMLFFSTNCAISLKVCTVYISKVSISYGARTCSIGYFTSSFFIKSYFLYLAVSESPFRLLFTSIFVVADERLILSSSLLWKSAPLKVTSPRLSIFFLKTSENLLPETWSLYNSSTYLSPFSSSLFSSSYNLFSPCMPMLLSTVVSQLLPFLPSLLPLLSFICYTCSPNFSHIWFFSSSSVSASVGVQPARLLLSLWHLPWGLVISKQQTGKDSKDLSLDRNKGCMCCTECLSTSHTP